MSRRLSSVIVFLFHLLFFFAPLVVYPYTSELFEFNKMVLVYLLTILIVAAWLTRIVLVRRLIFQRSLLDIPLLIFLLSQFLSFLVSIDRRTSILGYYSRFHGGLLSSISYALLYWAYVSNMNYESTKKAINMLTVSAVLVSIYGILQHFGVDKNLWVQDVQNRVFSTLGQPNWLAAWLVALMPVAWAIQISKSKYQKAKTSTLRSSATAEDGQFKNQRYLVWLVINALFLLTLLYTKSRSGILGFAAAYTVFWGLTLLRQKMIFRQFLIFTFLFLILAGAAGTPWTLPLAKIINPPTTHHLLPTPTEGGTESGEIRKIVWKGAIEIWKNYPILGTGPETFAYSYYQFRPKEHNLTSEWDFLYNKAHNEYLNFLANTGAIGLLTYLILILFSILQISNSQFLISKQIPIFKFQNSRKSLGQLGQLEIRSIKLALTTGYMSILITNFFGFSVVPVALLLFLYPAFAYCLSIQSNEVELHSIKLEGVEFWRKIVSILLLLTTLYLLLSTGKYWHADILYKQGKSENELGNYASARVLLKKAISLSPNEAVFWSELSESSAGLVSQDSLEVLGNAIAESEKGVALSPRNLSLLRNQAALFLKLSNFSPDFLMKAKDILATTTQLAPTHAKLFYNLGMSYARLGEIGEAIKALKKSIELKHDYRDARYALAILYIQKDEKELAKNELLYILEKIDPDDETSKEQVETL